MFNFLFKQNSIPRLVSPISGKCIKIEEVTDPTFSSKVMGDGFAVIPTDNVVLAPVAGEIKLISKTLHAFALETKQGVEVLVHIGLETVRLEGQGFTRLSQVGTKVKAGTPIIQFDKLLMEERDLDMTTIVVFLENGPKEVNLSSFGKDVKAGEELL